MGCNHKDCFTCPYEDCINDSGLGGKRGRKPLSPEEKAQHRKAYNQKYYLKHREERHQIYMARSEDTVMRRYATKTQKSALNPS